MYIHISLSLYIYIYIYIYASIMYTMYITYDTENSCLLQSAGFMVAVCWSDEN